MPSGSELIRQVKEQIREVDPPGGQRPAGTGRVSTADVDARDRGVRGRAPPGRQPRPAQLPRVAHRGRSPTARSRSILYCQSGNRSAWAARTLIEDLGYSNVESMTGGITLWKDRGYEVEVPRTLTAEQRDRYSRHLLIPEVGPRASRSCSTPRCCCWAPAGSARRPRCTWPRPAWARWGSSTTTWSTSPTSSAR